MKQTATEWLQTGAGRVFRSSGGLVQILSLFTIALILLPLRSSAADKTWTGAVNTNWSGSSNWSPIGMPTTNDTAIFDGAGTNFSNINLGNDRILTALSITSGQTNSVTINGFTSGTLTFTNAGTKISVDAGAHKITGTATPLVYFQGDAITNNIASGASFEIQGRIGKVSGGAENYYTKIGGGTLILSGDSGGSGAWAFLGGRGFNVQEGILRLTVNNAAGWSGNNFLVSSGAALEITNCSPTSGNGTWTLNGTGISSNGALRSIGGTNTLNSSGTGTVALASNSSIGVDTGTLTIKRVIVGTKALRKVGAGTLVLSTNNTYSGSTIVQSGTLVLGTNNTISASPNLTLSGGTLSMGSFSNALSTLTLAGDAAIDLGAGTGSLSFTNCSALSWTGTLCLTGALGDKTLRFGSDASGLNQDQKSKITWSGKPITLNEEGYVVLSRGTLFSIF